MITLKLPPIAMLPADFAREHPRWLRDLASNLMAHELYGERLPSYLEIERQAIAFEALVQMPDETAPRPPVAA